MILMGVWTGGRGDSSDDTDSDERDEGQTGLDDFDSANSDASAAAAGVAAGAAVGTALGAQLSGSAAPVSSGEQTSRERPAEEEPRELDQDEVEDRDESDGRDSERESDSEEDTESEDEDDEETLTITVTVDPLSALSWGIQPTIQRVRAAYGDQVDIQYQLAPVRTFDDPHAVKEAWIESTQKHSMPVDPSIWEDPPASTELLNRAVYAAEQQHGMKGYLRELWIEGIAAGNDVSDPDKLLQIARRLGFGIDLFREDMQRANLEESSFEETLPVTKVPINGYTQRWTRMVHYEDFKPQFMMEGLTEVGPPSLSEFVDRYGPVESAEISEVYPGDSDELLGELEQMDGFESVVIGEGIFWRRA